jgi:sodium/hydrogen antiporter
MLAEETAIVLFLMLAALVTALATRFGRSYISMPMVFVAAGVIIGPLLESPIFADLNREGAALIAELSLALILFADASTLDFSKVREDPLLPGRLLVIALPLTILLGAAAAMLLFDNIPLGYALLLASVLAPTDASLGLPIYTNPRVPARIRRALNIESGLNDGIASPFVVLFVGMTLSELGPAAPGLGGWLTEALVELGVAVITGLVVGAVAGRLLRTAISRGWTSGVWGQISIFALALGCYYLSVTLNGNGFVAVFIAGLIFGNASRHDLAEQTEFAEATGTLLSLGVWTAFGALLVAPRLADMTTLYGGRILLYAVLSLTIVRMLPVAISMIGTGLRRDTTLIMGWFGPRGLASVVFALLASIKLVEENVTDEPLALLMTATVLISVFAHGISAKPLVNWYANRLEKAEQSHRELEEVPEMPSRRRYEMMSVSTGKRI